VNDRYSAAVDAIDAANAADPTVVTVRGTPQPLALAHGQLATEWIEVLRPDADEALLLAGRAHHLRRWEVPRASYPEGRAGYLRWRRDQKARHAHDVATLLIAAGYDDDVIERVQALVRRDGLGQDRDAQVVEDAACLVFLETQLGPLSNRLGPDQTVDVLGKTARKLSSAGLAAAATIALDAPERELLAKALAG
jgi:hypothetical protein